MVQGVIFKAGLIAALSLLGVGIVLWKLFAGRDRAAKQETKGIGTGNRSHGEEERRNKLIAHLKSLKVQADKAEAEVIYSELFGRIGMPIQKLLALGEEQAETGSYAWRLEGNILSPIRDAVQIYQVSFMEDGITLPLKQTESEPGFSVQLEKLTERDLEIAVREYQGKIRCAQRYGIPRVALNKMASCLHRLVVTPAEELGLQQVQSMAEEVRKALIQSGIYPIYRQDEKLAGRPDLRALFIEVGEGGHRLPGLFIESNHQLQLYGNFQGTCYRGEE